MERISVHQPLVVMLDDLHWADELSAWALRVLVPGLSSFPVLWLLACRPMPEQRPAHSVLEWLITQHAQPITLAPLSDAEVAELCLQLLGESPSDELLGQLLRSGGNPFLVQELIATLLHEGMLSSSEGETRSDATELPPEFRQTVDRRLREMSEPARKLLDAGAVFARPFSIHEAAALIGRLPVELIPATVEVMQAGTLIDSGGKLSFRHDLIREVVYDTLAVPVRLALHREAVTVLQAEGRTALEVVEHLLRGGRTSDSRGADVLREAVDQVAITAPGTAADLVLRWLAEGEAQDCRRNELTALAVQLLAAAGRIEEAMSLGEQALQLGIDAVTEAELRLGLCHALKHAGQDRAVTEHAQAALVRADVPDGLRAQLLAIQAHGLLTSDEPTAADEVAARAVVLGKASGQYGAAVFATVARSCVARGGGDGEQALAFARDAVTMADHRGGDTLRWHPRLWLARALGACDRFAEADAVLELEQRQADGLGSPWSQPLWHYYRAELLMSIGRVDDAAAEAESGVRVAEQLDALALDVPLLALLSRISLCRDDLETGARYLARAEQLVAGGVGVAPGALAWPQALIQDALGQQQGLAEVLAPVYLALSNQSQLLIQEPRAAAQLVAFALRAGDRDRAELVVEGVRWLAGGNPGAVSFRAAALHAEGVQRADIALLLEAVEQYEGSPRLLDRAAAVEDAGLLILASDDPSTGAALLRQAFALYDGAGCGRDSVRVGLALRAHPVGRAVILRPVRDPGALTGSEVRVVELVIEGMTNREVAARLYLSPHTVDSHLRHSFAKLGLRSRVELTREVLRRPELLRIP